MFSLRFNTSAKPCPCGSGARYGACCEPLHRGAQQAPDAVTLMRSRYSAFALAQADYLWRTLHPRHDDRVRGEAEVLPALRRSLKQTRCLGLQVLDSRAGTDEAQVLFLARLSVQGTDRSFVELSTFLLEPDGWRYFSGVSVAPGRTPVDRLDIAGFQRLLETGALRAD